MAGPRSVSRSTSTTAHPVTGEVLDILLNILLNGDMQGLLAAIDGFHRLIHVTNTNAW